MLNIIYANNYFNLYQIVKTSKLKTYDNVKKKNRKTVLSLNTCILNFRVGGRFTEQRFFMTMLGVREHRATKCVGTRDVGQIETATSRRNYVCICLRYHNSFKYKKNIMHVYVIS